MEDRAVLGSKGQVLGDLFCNVLLQCNSSTSQVLERLSMRPVHDSPQVIFTDTVFYLGIRRPSDHTRITQNAVPSLDELLPTSLGVNEPHCHDPEYPGKGAGTGPFLDA